MNLMEKLFNVLKDLFKNFIIIKTDDHIIIKTKSKDDIRELHLRYSPTNNEYIKNNIQTAEYFIGKDSNPMVVLKNISKYFKK